MGRVRVMISVSIGDRVRVRYLLWPGIPLDPLFLCVATLLVSNLEGILSN